MEYHIANMASPERCEGMIWSPFCGLPENRVATISQRVRESRQAFCISGAQAAIGKALVELPRFGGQFNIWGLNPTLVLGVPLLIFHR